MHVLSMRHPTGSAAALVPPPLLHGCTHTQDTNQRLQAKVRDAAADSSASDAQLDALTDKAAQQQ
jgi:hypothetical protein